MGAGAEAGEGALLVHVARGSVWEGDTDLGMGSSEAYTAW